MNARNVVIALGGAAVLGIAVYVYETRDDHALTHTLPESTDSSLSAANELASFGVPLAPTASAGEPAPPVLDKQKRDAMRIAIYKAWGMAPPDENTHPSTWPARVAGGAGGGEGFGKDYIQDRIRDDYKPLAKQCYEEGLKKNPKLEGRIVASFRIVGTKGTGGLIDWVDLASEETTLDDPKVLECLKQSLYSVTFDPPPNDGVVTVTYPIRFANVEPDD